MATVKVNGQPISFRTIAVKLYLQNNDIANPTDSATTYPADNATANPTDSITDNSTDDPALIVNNTDNLALATNDNTDIIVIQTKAAIQPKRRHSKLYKHLIAAFAITVTKLYTDIILQKPSFQESRQKEIDSLFAHSVFKVVNILDLLANSQVFRSQFVDKVKFASTDKAYKKSRFVIQGYNDEKKSQILT